MFVLVDRDMVRNTGDIPTDTPQESSAVIDAKDEMISMLQGQLEAERQASAELRRIVAGLVQRVPELEPSRAPQEVSRADGEASAGEDTLTTPGGPEESVSRRSWWRRVLGKQEVHAAGFRHKRRSQQRRFRPGG